MSPISEVLKNRTVFVSIVFNFKIHVFEYIPVPRACGRLDALPSHGYTAEALRLAIVRTLKQGEMQSLLYVYLILNRKYC